MKETNRAKPCYRSHRGMTQKVINAASCMHTTPPAYHAEDVERERAEKEKAKQSELIQCLNAENIHEQKIIQELAGRAEAAEKKLAELRDRHNEVIERWEKHSCTKAEARVAELEQLCEDYLKGWRERDAQLKKEREQRLVERHAELMALAKQVEKTKAAEALAHDEGEVINDLKKEIKLLRESLGAEYAHHRCPDCPGRGSIIQLPPDEWKKGD